MLVYRTGINLSRGKSYLERPRPANLAHLSQVRPTSCGPPVTRLRHHKKTILYLLPDPSSATSQSSRSCSEETSSQHSCDHSQNGTGTKWILRVHDYHLTGNKPKYHYCIPNARGYHTSNLDIRTKCA